MIKLFHETSVFHQLEMILLFVIPTSWENVDLRSIYFYHFGMDELTPPFVRFKLL